MRVTTQGQKLHDISRYIWKDLVLNLELSDGVIEEYDGPFKWFTSPMVDIFTYWFNDLNIGKIKPEESFTNVCAE